MDREWITEAAFGERFDENEEVVQIQRHKTEEDAENKKVSTSTEVHRF